MRGAELMNKQLAESFKKEQENARKGLLIENHLNLPGIINLEKYNFLHQSCPTCLVNPYLWEHAKLNMNVGLFRVNHIEKYQKEDALIKAQGGKFTADIGDVFQIRGFDLANMTILCGRTGWIILDVLSTEETATHAWNFFKNSIHAKNTEFTLSGIIYSHSHVDHYGGIGGLKPYFSDTCEIYAPEGFIEHAVSENLYVGTAMKRRSLYQFGSLLDANPAGHIDSGIGKTSSNGTQGLIAPTKIISFKDYHSTKKYTVVQLDGITMHIQLTPGTEAPAEMNVYLPKYEVLFIAENCTSTMHNALTPRGAQVRDLLAWSTYLDETLMTFPEVRILCCAHTWPRFNHQDCVHFIELQRDLYRYIHNTTLHLINLGYTIDEVGRMLSEDGQCSLPEELANEWSLRGFYGTLNHNAKAVYQRYIGWYDGNPAHLNKHTPTEQANRYVKSFGAYHILYEAKKAIQLQCDEAWAIELLHYLLNADENHVSPSHRKEAKEAYAFALRKIGFNAEASTWRNMYLTAALEVEQDVIPELGNNYLEFSETEIHSLSLEMILQYMGIMLDGKRVEQYGSHKITANVLLTDTNEFATIKINRGILHYRIVTKSELNPLPTLTIQTDKLTFFRSFIDHDELRLSKIYQDNLIEYKEALIIQSFLTRFPINFPIMTPRKR